MIQQALSVAFAHAKATMPPSDISWAFDGGASRSEVLREKMKAHLDAADRRIVHARESGSRARAEMSAAFDAGGAQQEHLELLNLMIETIEARAEAETGLLARNFKRMARLAKQIESRDLAMKGFLVDTVSKLKAQAWEQVEELLDFALFLRALRAGHDPKRSVVATFTDDAELARFLGSRLGV